ncbi:MAG: DUF5048 domain-containing protein [Eubacteriales bacterium]|nr:DUF5048 domain-containing protein [Eubacteriales bacterium]
MTYQITNEDWELLTQPGYLIIRQKLRVLDDNLLVLKEIEGVIGNVNISENAESDVRKTTSFTMTPTWASNVEVNEESLIWLNRNLEIFIGILNIRTNEYKWYDQGLYIFTDTSSSYDEATNQLTVNCGDWWVRLDGTKNGQLGALSTVIPAYEEDSETGEVIKYNVIRDAIIDVARELGGVTRYQIDDFGEYYAMPQNNKDYELYRSKNDLWNTIPYDLEFSAGTSVAGILTELRDLYPNYELYFDRDVLVGGMIPSNEYDPVTIDNDQIQSILISENTTAALTAVRNICEVWGQVLETDWYADTVTASGDTYVITLDEYDEYDNGDKIALKVSETNVAGQKIQVNSLDIHTIYDPDTEDELEAGRMESGKTYVIQYKRTRVDGEYVHKFYLLGCFQCHAVDVLTGEVSESRPYYGRKYDKTDVACRSYDELKQYFKEKHNCDEITLTIVPDSPFTIQKIGEILDVKQGGEYEKIYSDSLASARAVYENWKNCRLTDNVSVTTKVIPFLKTNIKVEYQPKNQEEAHQYIIKSFSNDYENFTSNITMMRFYPLYIPDETR